MSIRLFPVEAALGKSVSVLFTARRTETGVFGVDSEAVDGTTLVSGSEGTAMPVSVTAAALGFSGKFTP